GSVRRLGKSMSGTYRVAARTLEEIVGRKPIWAYTRNDLLDYKDALLAAPKNWSTIGFATIREAVATNRAARAAYQAWLDAGGAGSRHPAPAMPRPTLSATRIQCGYLSALRQIFAHAKNNNCIAEDPTIGIGVRVSKRRKRKQDLRDPFSTDDLNAIFAAPLYAGARSSHYWHEQPSPGETAHFERGHRFWVPLCMLHMGLRPGEL